MLFDTHAHLNQEEFDADRDAVIARAKEAGVETIVCVGSSLESSEKCVQLAGQYDALYASVGIQPNYVHEAASGDWDAILRLVDQPKVVALGETGLDRYWDFAPFDLQQDYFDRHLRLSAERKLPFIVHMRDCEADIMAMLREAYTRGPLLGVMHSFTGDAEMAAECVAMGMYISFAGMVTFKKSDALRACAATVPEDRILIETDAPYLSPHPVRGQKPNEPALIRYTAECLAAVRGISLETFAAQTTTNARRLFQLD